MDKNLPEYGALTKDALLAELMRRDELDSNREIAPLRCPETAFRIDTTHLGIDQVVDQIVRHVRATFPEIFTV
jgi:cytidylate kinase